MNEIYLTIGILQITVSSTVLIYFLILYVQKYKYPNKSYSLSHGFFTSAMGVFYIVSSVILPSGRMFSTRIENESLTYLESFNQTKNPEYTNSFHSIIEENYLHMDGVLKNGDTVREEVPYDEREYFRKFLQLKPYILHRNYPRTSKNLHSLKKMSCKEMLFMYLLLVCSFVHAMVYLLANSIHNNLLLKRNNGNSNGGLSSDEALGEIVSAEQPATNGNIPKFIIALIIISEWVLPIIGSSVVVMMMKNDKINNYDVPYENFINVSKLNNENIEDIVNRNISLYTEVQNILNKIYDIVKNVNLTKNQETPNVTVVRDLNKDIYTCSDEGIALRVYFFILFVVGYLFTITYSKSIPKLPFQSTGYSDISKKLTLSFAIAWLPAVLEIVMRKYIGNVTPSSVSELMLLIGTFNQIFTNMLNMYIAKKFAKNLNFIVPQK